MKENELRNCPFCGGEAIIDINTYERSYRVACRKRHQCGAKFEWFDTEEEAIEAWNRRV